MKSFYKSWALAAILMAALASVLAPRAAAQGDGAIRGQILDVAGKPWAELGIQAVSEQGAKLDTKTDKDGNYVFRNLRSGIYTVYVQLPAPNKPYEAKCQVAGGSEAKVDLNFKDIASKQGAEYQEAAKKAEETKGKLEGLKAHFTAGNALIDQEKQAKIDLQKAPADQRDAAKQKLADLGDQAVKEFQEAAKSLVEKDPNAHLVWFKLGEAYDTAGRNDDAAQAYQQAITAKADVPGYYNNMGNVLARAGKIDEAKAAYTKSAELDPPNAATAWRNFGISLYNANRLGDAVEPLKKSAELDPKNPQTWYLLGASLVYKMTTKKVGDRVEVQFAPGTIEAYQKAVELDPNGTWGQQAKQGLEQLQLMAPGIDTKVNTKKKKS
ncbi:MAG TPA: tetratricopeptide repeat protein [Candidatus Acidoferrum sp.]|nr:tetratricopeptide repeat protein [Candidatus Acidoferrum sp.]